MTVLTVILNWRSAEMTLRAAEAALHAMEGIAGALAIVDNESGDGSSETMGAAKRRQSALWLIIWTGIRQRVLPGVPFLVRMTRPITPLSAFRRLLRNLKGRCGSAL